MVKHEETKGWNIHYWTHNSRWRLPRAKSIAMATSTPSPKSPAPVKARETILDCNVIPVYHNAISDPLLPMSSVRQLTALHKTHKKYGALEKYLTKQYTTTCNENWYPCIWNPSFSTAFSLQSPAQPEVPPPLLPNALVWSSPVPGVPSREGNGITRRAHLDTNSRETRQQQHNTETRVRGKVGASIHDPDVGGGAEVVRRSSHHCVFRAYSRLYLP